MVGKVGIQVLGVLHLAMGISGHSPSWAEEHESFTLNYKNATQKNTLAWYDANGCWFGLFRDII